MITRSEAIKQLRLLKADIINELSFVSKTKDKNLSLKSLDMAIASLETDEAYQLEYEQPEFCVDCISRQAVLVAMRNNHRDGGRDIDGDYIEGNYSEKLYDAITSLSTVTSQEPRKGHWIPVYQGDEIIDYRCSECEFGNTFGRGTIGMNFCPRCGSDNREVEE